MLDGSEEVVGARSNWLVGAALVGRTGDGARVWSVARAFGKDASGKGGAIGEPERRGEDGRPWSHASVGSVVELERCKFAGERADRERRRGAQAGRLAHRRAPHERGGR